jgi:hypothetical protein
MSLIPSRDSTLVDGWGFDPFDEARISPPSIAGCFNCGETFESDEDAFHWMGSELDNGMNEIFMHYKCLLEFINSVTPDVLAVVTIMEAESLIGGDDEFAAG